MFVGAGGRGAREVVRVVKNTWGSYRGLEFPVQSQITITCNPSSRGSDALFWPVLVQTCEVYTGTCTYRVTEKPFVFSKVEENNNLLFYFSSLLKYLNLKMCTLFSYLDFRFSILNIYKYICCRYFSN